MTTWLLGALIVVLAVRLIQQAMDGHAIAHQLTEISGTLRGLRTELEQIRRDRQDRHGSA